MAKKSISSAKRLFAELGAARSGPVVFTGMIKPADGDDSALMFARGQDCSRWTKIPLSMIEDVEPIRLVHCHNHAHHLVHLHMKGPSTPEETAFAAMAQLHHAPWPTTPPPGEMHRAGAAMNLALPPTPGATPCYFDWGLGRWVCP